MNRFNSKTCKIISHIEHAYENNSHLYFYACAESQNSLLPIFHEAFYFVNNIIIVNKDRIEFYEISAFISLKE